MTDPNLLRPADAGTREGGGWDASPPVVEVVGVPVVCWGMRQTVDAVGARLAAGRFTHIASANAAIVMWARDDPAYREMLLGADLICPDGMSVAWAMALLGTAAPERVAGIDLMLQIARLAAARRASVFLLGAAEDVVQKAARRMEQLVPRLRVAGTHHGYFWEDEAAAVAQVQAAGAEIVLVAISSPLRERFLHRWKRELGATVVMEVGGSFEVLAGRLRRAPVWCQRLGIEWLFRLIQEPARLWRRYLVTSMRFIGVVAVAMLWRLFSRR